MLSRKNNTTMIYIKNIRPAQHSNNRHNEQPDTNTRHQEHTSRTDADITHRGRPSRARKNNTDQHHTSEGKLSAVSGGSSKVFGSSRRSLEVSGSATAAAVVVVGVAVAVALGVVVDRGSRFEVRTCIASARERTPSRQSPIERGARCPDLLQHRFCSSQIHHPGSDKLMLEEVWVERYPPEKRRSGGRKRGRRLEVRASPSRELGLRRREDQGTWEEARPRNFLPCVGGGRGGRR